MGTPLSGYARRFVGSKGEPGIQGAQGEAGSGLVDLQTNIVAFAGGGQANATDLTSAYSKIGTVATTNDSCKLMAAVTGTFQEAYNAGANDMKLFPRVGDRFIGLSVNDPITIVAGQKISCLCYDSGVWTY